MSRFGRGLPVDAGAFQARSSGGEHYLDTVGVSGSNPLGPTIFPVASGDAAGVSVIHTLVF